MTQLKITDDLDALLDVLPLDIRHAVERANDSENLLEIILDLGRVPTARFVDHEINLRETEVTRSEIDYVDERTGEFDADNRAGIERTLHRISAIRNRRTAVVGLTLRVGRAVYGTVDIIQDIIESGKSVLILGRPGVGKTTLLREAARILAEQKRVVIVDTSNEIGGDGDVPHPAVGKARRMQVKVPTLQHEVMIEAVENHNPEVIVIDEIGRELEALAARTIAERGVQLIGTAHGQTLDNLLLNPTLSDLVGGIEAVTLSDEEARRRGTQKTVLERNAPPTFDVLIEIHDRYRLALHPEVAEAVDSLLRGRAPRIEIRARREDGHVEISHPVQTEPAVEEPRPERRKLLRIFPYGINRHRLEQAIHELEAPARLVHQPAQAEVILTVRGQVKRQPKEMRQLVEQGTLLYTLRSDTVMQMAKFLREQLADAFPEDRAAIVEAEAAISQVLDRHRPVELTPQKPRLRRLQHELVKRYGLVSKSEGEEPFRRLVIYPS